MSALIRNFEDVHEMVRKGATLPEVWEIILKTPILKNHWKDVFGYQEGDFKIWSFLLQNKQRKHLFRIEDHFEKDLLSIHWREISPLLPNSLQRSLAYLSEEFLKEGYYEQFFRKSLGGKPY